mmetsp:Transcript_31949/g.64193  ORF Transcript_31949/g.64193 Transcript_31949/m.64193 type:complete len:83 (-) Transcript_31949:261-509(-)
MSSRRCQEPKSRTLCDGLPSACICLPCTVFFERLEVCLCCSGCFRLQGGDTCLHLAAACGNVDFAKMLEANAEVNVKICDGL